MEDIYNLNRFVQAQEHAYAVALQELKEGRKRSHWIWYIFPQMRVLGRSYNSNYYGLTGVGEARAYLEHQVLGPRLREVCDTIMELETDDPRSVFGGIDSVKLRSSLTLFDLVQPDDIFAALLQKYFGGHRDHRTLRLAAE